MAIAIITFIFIHSPDRPTTSPGDDAARWVERTKAEAAEAAFRSGVVQDLLRRSVTPDERPVAKPRG